MSMCSLVYNEMLRSTDSFQLASNRQPCLAEQTNFTAVGEIDNGCGRMQHRFYPALLWRPFAPFEAQFQPIISRAITAPHVHFPGHYSTDRPIKGAAGLLFG